MIKAKSQLEKLNTESAKQKKNTIYHHFKTNSLLLSKFKIDLMIFSKNIYFFKF